MQSRTELDERRTPQTMPGTMRALILAAVGLVLAGALYLIAVRGEALLVDLSAFSQRIFCF